MTMHPELSIIIPHYNSPKELKILLKSIYDENEDIEVIVVDDSSDSDIDLFYACKEQYEALGAIFLKNESGIKGPGKSRNIGLEHATGRWILFADADDYFLNNFYEKIKPYFNSQYDIVYFTPTSINLDTMQEGNRHLLMKRFIDLYKKDRSYYNLLQLKYRVTTVWSKLICRELIEKNGIEFEEILVAEDRMFSTQSSFWANNIAVDDNIIYCITRKVGTLTTKQDKELYFVRLHTYVRSFDFLKSHLNKEEFKLLDLHAISRIGQAITNRYSLPTIVKAIMILKKNRIKLFSKDMEKPVVFVENMMDYFSMVKEEKKYYVK